VCSADRRPHGRDGAFGRFRARHAFPKRRRGARSHRGDQTLITLAHVVGFDETTLRAGAAGAKQCRPAAATETATVYHLGGRDLDSFAEDGILPEFAGVAMHDRYINYFHRRWENLAGHQACAAHLLRDFADAAETYPQAHWPAQAQRVLRGLIKAWHHTRDNGLAEIEGRVAQKLSLEFCRAVRVGLSQVPRVPYWYHAVFTDSPFPLAHAESDHRGHAVVEQVFADLIDDRGRTCPRPRSTPTPPGSNSRSPRTP
jgi:Transposase IS66 family